MNSLVVDSSAWIEYLQGTPKGRRLQKHFENSRILTTGVVVAEVSVNFIKAFGTANEVLTVMRSKATLIPFDFELGKESAEIYVQERKTKNKFGLADAHLVAIARKTGSKVLTCDNDFSGLPEAIIIN